MMIFGMLEKKGGLISKRIKSFREQAEKKREQAEKKALFLKDLEQARDDLNAARHNYNFAKDSGLLEYYIYEIKAAETRLNYFLQLAKKEQLSNDVFRTGVMVQGGKRGEGI